MIGEYFKGTQPTVERVTDYLKKYGGKIVKTVKGTYLIDDYEATNTVGMNKDIFISSKGKAIELDTMMLIDKLDINGNHIVAVEVYKANIFVR